MTTRERIATLYDGGTEPHMIAALLNLAVADVVTTLADPSHTPADPVGGSTPPPNVNWCILEPEPVTLTVAASRHTYADGELSIFHQSGTDFSLGEDEEGNATLVTASGGRFQAACYVGGDQPGSVWAPDEGSEQQRYLEFQASMGPASFDDPTNPNQRAGFLGLDTLLPITTGNNAANTPVSAMGYSSPGKCCLHEVKLSLINGFGTDSLTADSISSLQVWQV